MAGTAIVLDMDDRHAFGAGAIEQAGDAPHDFFAAMQKGGPQPTWARDAWARTVLCPAESPLPSLISRRAISSLPA